METEKQITEVKDQVGKMSEAIASLPAVITTQEEYDTTHEIGKKVGALLKNIDKEEKSITKPINDSLKKIRDMFRPFKTQVTEVSNDLKKRRQTWIDAEAKKARIEEERIAKRVEKGTMREDTAVGKLADIEQKAPDTKGGMTSVLVVKVIDVKLIPEKYLTVNESAIKADHREGVDIPGVECTYEQRARN